MGKYFLKEQCLVNYELFVILLICIGVGYFLGTLKQ
jgi:hypothetical protein